MRRRQWEIDAATGEIVVWHRSSDSQVYSLLRVDDWLGAAVQSAVAVPAGGLSAVTEIVGTSVNVKITGGAGSVDVAITNPAENKRRDVRFRVDPVGAGA